MTAKRKALLSAVTLEEAQAMTGRIWSRHRSAVAEPGEFRSDIERYAVGQSHVAMVECGSAIAVDVEGCVDRVFVYLPVEGRVEFEVGGERLAAGPGGLALMAPGGGYRFEATPVRCLVLEVRLERLAEELKVKGYPDGRVGSMAWEAGNSGADGVTALVGFVYGELRDTSRPPPSVRYLRRMDAVLLTSLARLVAGAMAAAVGRGELIGRRTLDEVEVWMKGRVERPFAAAELAAYAGLTVRSMQRGFIRHFHSTPVAYLQGLRLEGAREALLAGRGRLTVADVAPDYQFHHLGRFASAYRRKFGESPSTTIGHLKETKA